MVRPEADIELPPIFCPLEPAIHPRAQEIERQADAWIKESGMCATDEEYRWVTATHSVNFYARFAPGAADERLLATALWVYWGFAFDDARCDSGPLSDRPGEFAALAGRVQRAVESPTARDAGERFVPPLRRIVGRFRELGTPVQVRRFAQAHRAWLAGVQWQIGNEARGTVPDLDDYLAMRLLASGGEPTFAMLEIADGAEVPARELESPAVRALTEMAILVAALDNDRHSVRKELSRGQTGQNIYSVLMRHHGLALPQALSAAGALRDRVLLRFLRLAPRVAAGAGAELRAYIRDLGHGIRGNAEWGLRVPRYLSLGRAPDPFAADSSLRWAERPGDPRAAPPLTPAVSWWWDAELG
ncbi:terpene synthase family protein [Streptomyces hoynatensis]|uniref:Terpene synthase n=1 Tax=Streptomyces hoynatensis TaxID=1141874 RepID=A0A3A9YZE1_9ACTN|nr:hypothetical protein [Streptomyces hoynatensis]RKN41230.1 hypothetical protein D7294_15995 [Streptomyces hoynatensis]